VSRGACQFYTKSEAHKQLIKLNASEGNLFKKMPSGVFEKFPFTFFEATHNFAAGTK
jgi:hypothetical protein